MRLYSRERQPVFSLQHFLNVSNYFLTNLNYETSSIACLQLDDQHGLYHRSQTRHISEERLGEAGYANAQVSQHIVYVFAVLGRVREAARIDKKGWMLEERGRAGWRHRFADGVVGAVPDDFIRFIFEDCSKKWFNAFDVNIVSFRSEFKSQ